MQATTRHHPPQGESQPVLPEHFQRLERRMQEAFDKRPESFESVLFGKNPSPELVKRLGEVKRFLELWTADGDIRAAAAEDPQALLDRLGLDLKADEIRYLYDEGYFRDCLAAPDFKAPLIVQQYRLWCAEKSLHREKIRRIHSHPQSACHAAWRERQINRCRGTLGHSHAVNIVHAPFAIELSDGCSVGCWFCGVSAEKRRSDFEWNPANVELWKGVVSALREVIGPAARQGFCYWGTDPLDNPHYEDFCVELAKITGRFPQTTTAQAHKHIERVRKLLPLSRSYGCEINRFSVLSLGLLKKLHSAFTPSELLWTELVTQNMEATSMQSNAGRARNSSRLKKKAELTPGVSEGWEDAPGTIACVSGFLLNMVHRSVKLVSPTASCDRWPNGYWIVEEATFTDGESLRDLLTGMIERHMPMIPDLDRKWRFRRDLRVSLRSDAVELHSWGLIHRIPVDPAELEAVKALVAGQETAREMILRIDDQFGVPSEETLVFLCKLFDEGFLNEEPTSVPAATNP